MKVIYCKTLWGVTKEMGNSPSGYAALFARIKADGFTAIETPYWLIEDPAAFRAALDATGLHYIAMINTCLPDLTRPPGATHALPSQALADHIASFEAQLAGALALGPLKVNSHSGCDLWPLATAREFFVRALAAEAAAGIEVCHETHRGRALYNPWVARDLCRELPSLKLTADLSHFCVVAERVFQEGDQDWQACMAEFARATRHIHARVGYAQGPQVPDPRAPEYQDALVAHERWWDQILGASPWPRLQPLKSPTFFYSTLHSNTGTPSPPHASHPLSRQLRKLRWALPS
jgi:sugar phosphate isomerase/epimerase